MVEIIRRCPLSIARPNRSPPPAIGRLASFVLASGLMFAALSIWPITLSAYAQEYCPSGQVVTAQSQCAGAVGPVDNLTKSILRLNGSGFYNANKIPMSQQGVENNTSGSNNASLTAIKPHNDNNTNSNLQTHQNTTGHTNMTQYVDREGRFTISYPSTWSATTATNRFQTNALTIRAGPDSGILIQILDTAPFSSSESFARSMKQAMVTGNGNMEGRIRSWLCYWG